MQRLGKYQLVRKLAVGGMAEVFLAKAAGPMGFEKTLVLKRILPNLAADPQFVRMFLAEAKLAASLNHPNIAQIFDFGEAEGAYFIAMEHVDGPNLRSLSRRATERTLPLPISLCAKIVSYACEALAFAHEFIDPGTATHLSVIHRDVSPENILLSRNGSVKVVDFGIAKAVGQTHHTKSGILRGKISYMPPEQIQGKVVDHRADTFALGVVFYELMTGCKPFDARTDVTILQAILYEQMIPAAARRPDIPEAIGRILQRALAKDPDARYPTCRHFQAELERFIVGTGEPVGPYQLATLVARLSGTTTAFTAATPLVAAAPRAVPPTPRKGSPGSLPATPRARVSASSGPAARPVPDASLRTTSDNPGASIARGGSRRLGALVVLLGTLIALGGGGGYALLHRGPQEAITVVEMDDDRRAPDPQLESPAPASSPERPRPIADPPPSTQVGTALGGTTSDRLADDGRNADHINRRKSSRRELATHVASRTRSTRRPSASEDSAAPGEGGSGAGRNEVAPRLASLALESVPAGQIRVNGKLVGSSPVRINSLPPGEIRVEVYNSTVGFSKEEVFSVDAGENGTKRIVLGQGSLEFRVRPFATVFLDGKLLGQTPFAPVQVYEGKHTVKLVNRDLHKEIAVDCVVKPGQSNIFKYNLSQPEN